MKKCFTLFLLLFSIFSAQAQRVYSVVFDKLPENYQLYPRNTKNESYIPIAGVIEILGWKYLSVQVFREDKLIDYQRADIIYTDTLGKFKFKPITIKAELAEYSLKIFAMSNKGDSIEMVSRKHIVCGDAYVIGGQSNAVALFGEGYPPYYNRFARTYGASFPYEDVINWQISEIGNYRVGQIGGGLQRKIIEKYKIPVCIINRAVGGINLGASLIRDPNNLGDLSNLYGMTYSMIKSAGLMDGGVKAFIWRQGENESSGGAMYWGELFDKLYKYWHQDMPNINKYYIFQVGLIAWPENSAGALRDYQRRTSTIYNDVSNLTCIGTQGYDGVHYDTSGYSQTVRELFRMIDRDFYNGKYAENINSPNIQRAYFSKSNRKEITLEFEKDQRMVWVEDTVLIDKQGNALKQYMKNMFYFNGNSENTLVENGKAINNKIILTLNAPAPQNKFNYLPSFHDDKVFQQFGGPFLKNTIGMRAFSFDQVAIEEYVEPIIISDLVVNGTYDQLKVSWKATSNVTSYILERRSIEQENFQEIAKLSGKDTEYIDTQLKENTVYFYRLKAWGDKTESDYMQIQAHTSAILGNEQDTQNEIVLYPNPANTNAIIKFRKPMTGKIGIANLSGLVLFEQETKGIYEFNLPINNIQKGTYLVTIKNESGTFIKKLIINN